MSLLGPRVAVFPTGIGDEGGSFGLQRHFHPLRAIMDRDMTSNGHKIFHAIALFDDDIEGNRGFAALTGQHLNYRKWRDVFLLQRFIPRSTRDPVQVEKLVENANKNLRRMECEIEDLVAISIIKEFVKENPHCIQRQMEERDGAVHCRFHRHFKANFIRFVERNAILDDLKLIVETLKSLRYHLGLIQMVNPRTVNLCMGQPIGWFILPGGKHCLQNCRSFRFPAPRRRFVSPPAASLPFFAQRPKPSLSAKVPPFGTTAEAQSLWPDFPFRVYLYSVV